MPVLASAPEARIPEPKRPEPGGALAPQVGGAYANYLLAVLVLVYVINFLDRQIIAILAEDIKADLGVSDASIGFLYGTAFAVFYAIFGIPLGRLADVWNRRSLIAIGLGFWSLMTAFSGFARNFGELAAARIGVGVGEASASPAAFSMLSDSFPARRRATVLALYSTGVYLGGGLGLMIGGQIVDRWNAAYPPGTAPFGLVGWQAAYLLVGLPGLLLAVWVSTLREPVRGAADGVVTVPDARPMSAFLKELRAVVPPFTLWHLAREGAGSRAIVRNLVLALVLAALGFLLVRVTGDAPQWIALPIGIYAAVSWASTLGLRDRPCAELIFRTPTLRHLALGLSLLAFTGYGLGGWAPVYFRRVLGQPTGEVGTYVGLTAAAAGVLGVTIGGLWADRLRGSRPEGRLYVALVAAACSDAARLVDALHARRSHRLHAQLPGLDVRLDVDRRGRLHGAGPGAPAHAFGRVRLLHPRDHVRRLRARPLLHRRALRRARGSRPGDAADAAGEPGWRWSSSGGACAPSRATKRRCSSGRVPRASRGSDRLAACSAPASITPAAPMAWAPPGRSGAPGAPARAICRAATTTSSTRALTRARSSSSSTSRPGAKSCARSRSARPG